MVLDENEAVLLESLLRDTDKRQAMVDLLQDEHALEDVFYGLADEAGELVQDRLTREEVKFVGSFAASRSKVSAILDRAHDVAVNSGQSSGMRF